MPGGRADERDGLSRMLEASGYPKLRGETKANRAWRIEKKIDKESKTKAERSVANRWSREGASQLRCACDCRVVPRISCMCGPGGGVLWSGGRLALPARSRPATVA